MLQYKKLTETEIIELAKNNDFKALEELIRRNQKNVFATFSFLVKKRENIADLTQETLLRVAKNLNSLKNPKNFKSWLNQIITNLYYDEIRKNNKKPECISIDENPLPIVDLKCKPHEKCISSELDQVIKKAILELPEHFKIAIILREFEGLSYEEIAKLTNTNIGTVKSRISRARDRLQCDLQGYI